MTDSGALELSMPRDRQSSFDPQLIAKYQRRFAAMKTDGRILKSADGYHLPQR